MNTSPIAAVVAPFKSAFITHSVHSFRARVERTLDELAEAGWDANALAPYPRTDCGRKQYKETLARYDFVRAITKADDIHASYRFGKPEIRHRAPEKIELIVEQVRAMAGASYDSYVAKLESKVGEHVAAEMDYGSGSLWSGSVIRVRKADGSVERWKTQIIVNYSVYGTPYNQWPTRRIK